LLLVHTVPWVLLWPCGVTNDYHHVEVWRLTKGVAFWLETLQLGVLISLLLACLWADHTICLNNSSANSGPVKSVWQQTWGSQGQLPLINMFKNCLTEKGTGVK